MKEPEGCRPQRPYPDPRTDRPAESGRGVAQDDILYSLSSGAAPSWDSDKTFVATNAIYKVFSEQIYLTRVKRLALTIKDRIDET